MKRLRYFNIFIFLFVLCGCAARPARAQFIGYYTPQSVTQTLATNTACTGSSQTFVTANLGQTQHSAILTMTASAQKVNVLISATDSGGNNFVISPAADFAQSIAAVSSVVNASGYYPKVSVIVICSPGTATFTLTYSGTSSTPNASNGASLLSLLDQQIFFQIPGNAVQTLTPATPFGNSSGMLLFSYASAPVAGSTLSVTCTSTASSTLKTFSFPIANATGGQIFTVPPSPCLFATVTYTNGGAGGNVTVDYLYDSPGNPVNTTLGTYTHVTGTTATAAKATAGTLVSLTVNTPAAGTISIFDLATASCTGTPATNVVSVITATATAPLATFPYNVNMLNGICVKASVAMDFTVSTQ